jgi:hypothetical protein
LEISSLVRKVVVVVLSPPDTDEEEEDTQSVHSQASATGRRLHQSVVVVVVCGCGCRRVDERNWKKITRKKNLMREGNVCLLLPRCRPCIMEL